MTWLIDLFQNPSAAHTVLIISIVAALGLALGSIRFFKISLGIGGVLFAGLLFGHLGFKLDEHVLEFIREFGLILFVYSIGLQVGPGFIASLRRHGLPLNIMAGSIVLLGVFITILLHFIAGIPMPIAVGLFSGATTNTPALASAQQAMKDLPNLAVESSKLPGLGYAISYPFGILGIILTIILIRYIFRINPQQEAAEFIQQQVKSGSVLSTVNLEVKNSNMDGLPVEKIPMLEESGIVISRIMHQGQVTVAQPDTILRMGDVLLAVGLKEHLEELRLIIGDLAKIDLKSVPSKVTTKRIIVTKNEVLGKTVDELDFLEAYDVTISRISRADIEFTPTSQFRFQFGDTVLAVGEEEAIKKVTVELGNSLRQLNHPQLVPVMVGISLGVILGSYPIFLPGIPAPVKLGLAGGPLLVAILLSRIGRIGPLNWYLPISANFMLREIGIVLFLSCVGLRAGDRFLEILFSGDGLYWVSCAVLITLIPIFLVAIIARLIYKVNFMSICGLLAGSMTDPPALAFSSSISNSDAPNISYATVYPLVMFMRVLSAQLLVLLLPS